MKLHGPLTVAFGLLLGLFVAAQAPAQFRLFGSKSDKASKSTADTRRIIEINVEVAWLADPVTFPYYLEAHVNSSQQLEVRGYVPNRAVRDHALRLAQVYSSLPVTDGMKEHASLLVRPTQMSKEQLHNSVQSTLRVALPKHYQHLRVECESDGKVFVFGTVSSHEEKVSVSHSLRRLHGCTSVQNMTTVPLDLAQQSSPPDGKSKSWFPWLAKGTKQEPPAAEPRPELKGPILVDVSNRKGPEAGPEVIKVELPVKPALDLKILQQRIRQVCPKVTQVEAAFTSVNEVRIFLHIPSANDINSTAERIFLMPELQNYRPSLQFKIAVP